jgi:hypothetical protein
VKKWEREREIYCVAVLMMMI